MASKRNQRSNEVKKDCKRRKCDLGVMNCKDERREEGGRVCGKRPSSDFSDDSGDDVDQLCKKLKESVFLGDRKKKKATNLYSEDEHQLCERFKQTVSFGDLSLVVDELATSNAEAVQKISVTWLYMYIGEGVLELITSALAANNRRRLTFRHRGLSSSSKLVTCPAM